MYEAPVIQHAGKASRLVQTKTIGSGDGTNAGFSRVEMPASVEIVGSASQLIQAALGSGGDGQQAGHSKIQLPPRLEAE